MPTPLPNSQRWAAMQTLFAALQSAPALAGVRILRNPRTPDSLSASALTVVLKDQTDTLLSKPGQDPKRSHQFLLAVVARTDDADAQADALHEAACSVLRTSHKQLNTGSARALLSEHSTQFEAAALEVDGALCLSTWTLVYDRIPPGMTG